MYVWESYIDQQAITDIEKQTYWINTIAASTFGVLCIHANSDTMRQWLWQDVVDCSQSFYRNNACLYAFFVVLVIFFICILIDYIRIHTIERLTFLFIDKHILNKYIIQK